MRFSQGQTPKPRAAFLKPTTNFPPSCWRLATNPFLNTRFIVIIMFISKTQAFYSHFWRSPTYIHVAIHHYFYLALTSSIVFHEQFPGSACSCYLCGICRYADVPSTAGITQLCSGHIHGPIWVFQVHNTLVESHSLGSQYCIHTHTIRLDFGKPSMNQPHPPQPVWAQHATWPD